ncbi:uncharacterized protein CANTADRAFT_34693, partial [Suhomyces tanzawaensis NRRL Y-17324]
SQVEVEDDQEVNLSETIPQLQALIDRSDNSKELEQEIKVLFMRGYWNGFYAGFE